MSRSMILLLLLISTGAWALPRPNYAAGVALEAREMRDVNPDANGTRGIGQMYGQVRFKPWALELEAAHDSDESHSGSLSVKSQSTMVGAWGRFEYLHPADYDVFASVGVGAFFDQVDTQFQASNDHRSGTRDFMGVGTGIGTLFWDHMQLELEGRILSIQETKDPVLSALVRLGCQI